MDEKDTKTGRADASNEHAPPGAPVRGTAPSGAVPSPSPDSVPHRAPDIRNDIAKILDTVKLPERRTPELSGEKTKQAAEVKPIDELLSRADAIAATPPERAEKGAPQAARKGALTSVHTLKDDLLRVVRERNISVVRAAALEEEKRGGAEAVESVPRHSRAGAVLGISVLLLFLGLSAFGGVYYVVRQREAPAPVSVGTSLIFAEDSAALPLDETTPSTLKARLSLARGGGGALGSITRIVPLISADDAVGTQRPATLRDLIAALGIAPPEELLRALSDDFFLGIHTVDKNAPFLIVPVLSYERAFAGMLAWEPTMNGDLAPLFLPLSRFTQKDGIPVERVFTDSVFRNYDVRQLSDDGGSVVLYYSFPTRGVLVIAESPYTFTETLTRLQVKGAI